MAKTIYNQELSDGTSVKCRKVYHRELKCSVLVTTSEEYETHAIEEDSADDRLFYCYPNDSEFMSMDDAEFEDYVNQYFD